MPTSHQEWLADIASALRREEAFRKAAAHSVSVYESVLRAESSFNILYSNTQTLAPALYNSPPRPVTKPRSKVSDPISLAAAKLLNGTLEYLLDDGLGGASSFDSLMERAVLEALVPGRGVTRFKYESVVAEAAEGETGEVVSEEICGEFIPWNRFLHGYAASWDEVPWVAFRDDMDAEELKKHFPGVDIPLSQDREPDDFAVESRQRTAGSGPSPRLAKVYTIWCKESKQVYFVSPDYADGFLKDPIPDPFSLSCFFPCPQPLSFFTSISALTPTPLYTFYEEQAKELNRVSQRINKLISAMKVRGFYDSTIEGMSKLLDSPDNTLIPAEGVAGLVQGTTLEKAIWLFPIEKLVAVLQQLYVQRNQVKQVIYEITGIADIMRGSSAASETLGAQEIKNQWGTLRMKRAQKAVGNYARDCLRIMAELSLKLPPETLQTWAGTKFPTEEQVQRAQQLSAQLAQVQQPPPPELSQILSSPPLSAVRAALENPVRNFRLTIETNSTVDAEATEDKQNIAELLNALSQFLNGVQPLIESGALPFDAAKGMLLAITKRFRFGPELEEELAKMAAPQPKADPKAEQMKQQGELEKQKAQMDLQMKQAELHMAEQKLQMELEFAKQEHQFRMMAAQEKMKMDQQNWLVKQQQRQYEAANSPGVTGQ